MKTELRDTDKFKFACHPGLECFGKCCRDINIFITPYDVLRLKNTLGLTSTEFLKKHAIRHTVPFSGYPVVQLRMREDEGLLCAFITAGGCAVYAERPWSCRMAPVEMQGEGIYGFCFNPSFCRGLDEEKEQTVREWMSGQEMEIYDEIESLFKEIPLRLKFTGDRKLDNILAELFFTACYDLDRFRRLVLSAGFKDTFNIDEETAEKISLNDVELLKFGFRWLVSGITGRETLKRLAGMLASG
ncbi:MAG: YkgJ family cysteine cluster protein [Eubacteriales bacterium]